VLTAISRRRGGKGAAVSLELAFVPDRRINPAAQQRLYSDEIECHHRNSVKMLQLCRISKKNHMPILLEGATRRLCCIRIVCINRIIAYFYISIAATGPRSI